MTIPLVASLFSAVQVSYASPFRSCLWSKSFLKLFSKPLYQVYSFIKRRSDRIVTSFVLGIFWFTVVNSFVLGIFWITVVTTRFVLGIFWLIVVTSLELGIFWFTVVTSFVLGIFWFTVCQSKKDSWCFQRVHYQRYQLQNCRQGYILQIVPHNRLSQGHTAGTPSLWNKSKIMRIVQMESKMPLGPPMRCARIDRIGTNNTRSSCGIKSNCRVWLTQRRYVHL